MLTRAGHTVVSLEDGFELADYLELVLAAGGLELPDLILSDVRMPGRTGLEVLAQVRQRGDDVSGAAAQRVRGRA